MKSVYLASALGFSDVERNLVLPRFVEALEALGLSVHEPFADSRPIVDARETGWAYEVGQRDLAAVRRCDGLFAVVNGSPPDEGVMVELGVAVALEKPVFFFRDDFRRSSDCEDYPLNLMLFVGHPRNGWREYLYRSLDELSDPERPLARWARGER